MKCAFCGRVMEKPSSYKNCCRIKCKVAWNQDNLPHRHNVPPVVPGQDIRLSGEAFRHFHADDSQ